MTQTPKPTKKPTSIATKESTLKPTKVPTMKPMKEPSVNSVVKFTIEPGMSSQEISGILYKKGLVDNSSNFNAYITALDKAGDIRIGSYAISHGATYNEIVKEIAP
jgi:cell division protein YceG involved in septum cleavage